jgi:hypothetical protein
VYRLGIKYTDFLNKNNTNDNSGVVGPKNSTFPTYKSFLTEDSSFDKWKQNIQDTEDEIERQRKIRKMAIVPTNVQSSSVQKSDFMKATNQPTAVNTTNFIKPIDYKYMNDSDMKRYTELSNKVKALSPLALTAAEKSDYDRLNNLAQMQAKFDYGKQHEVIKDGTQPTWGKTIIGGIGQGVSNLAGGFAKIPGLIEDVGEQITPQFIKDAAHKVDVSLMGEQGAQNFNKNFKDAIDGQEWDDVTKSIQKWQGYENARGAKKFASDVVSSTPQMALNFVPVYGPVLFGVNAGTNYADQAKDQGASPIQSVIYGGIGGAAEVTLNKALDLIPGYQKVFEEAFSKNAIKNATKDIAKSGMQVGKQMLKNAGKEAIEEAAVDPVLGLAEKATYNPNKKYFGDNGVFDVKQMGYDALAGFAMGGLVDSPAMVKQASTMVQAKKFIENQYPVTLSLADALPENTASYQISQALKKLDTKVTLNDVTNLIDLVRKDYNNLAASDMASTKGGMDKFSVQGTGNNINVPKDLIPLNSDIEQPSSGNQNDINSVLDELINNERQQSQSFNFPEQIEEINRTPTEPIQSQVQNTNVNINPTENIQGSLSAKEEIPVSHYQQVKNEVLNNSIQNANESEAVKLPQLDETAVGDANIPTEVNKPQNQNYSVLEHVGEEVAFTDHNGLTNGGTIIKNNENGTHEVEFDTQNGKQYAVVKREGNEYKAVLSDPTPSAQIPMNNRTLTNVGNKNVKSYQYLHPELKGPIQSEAQVLLGELDRTIKPDRGATTNRDTGETTGYGHGRIAGEGISQIIDYTGGSYTEIRKALNNIIKDHGSENYALAKKIEVLIDDRLSNGYKDDILGHDIPANQEYINLKNSIEGRVNSENQGAVEGQGQERTDNKNGLAQAKSNKKKISQDATGELKKLGAKVVQPKTATLKHLQKLMSRFNTKVVYYESKDGKPLPDGFYSKADSDTIFIHATRAIQI